MEDDDDFGDLYTDVLQPLATSLQFQPEETDAPASSKSRPIGLNNNSDDEEILYGASDSKKSDPHTGLNLNPSSEAENLSELGAQPQQRRFDRDLDSNLEASRVVRGDGLEFGARVLDKGEGVRLQEKGLGDSSFMGDDNDIDIVVEERDNKDDDLVEKDADFTEKQENIHNTAEQNEKRDDFMGPSFMGEVGSGEMFPGLSGRMENQGGSNFEDEWESDESEDDLQIVLNDNSHGPMGMERMPGMLEDDGEGEPLVILADGGELGHQKLIMDEQELGGEGGEPVADGERKELGDIARASGGGGAAAPPSVQPKIGYSTHMYHLPFNSQFKYVRPGAAPIPGATPGGIPGQSRPPMATGTVAGYGRGDWRPAGIKGAVPIQKGFHPGYGMPVWGANVAGRGYGTGLDFTLPSHKTIFEVDIDGFEEKPWKLPGMDMSDFFNFGLNDDSWKDYCKQLEQLRLETTMQSKIRVYESGRAEPDYDPDLPPELAAAVGIQEIRPENTNTEKADAIATDLSRASSRGQPPVQPVGRPIPVETGSGDRLPSIDTRRPRIHDSDAIIEIVCRSSAEDDDMAEQLDNNVSGEHVEGPDEIDESPQDVTENIHPSPHAYKGRTREIAARRAQLKTTFHDDDIGREAILHVPEVPVQFGDPHEARPAKGRGRVKSPMMTTSNNRRQKHIVDNQNEESFDSENGQQSTPLSSSHAVESDGAKAVTVGDDVKDESEMDGRSSDVERDDVAMDATNNEDLGDGPSMHTEKQKVSSFAGQLFLENDGEDSNAGRSSENSKPKSGSNRDPLRGHDSFDYEVIQDRIPPYAGNDKQPVRDEYGVRRKGHLERDETARLHMAVKGRGESHSHKGGDLSSSLQRHMKSENADWRKESYASEANLRRRDEDLHGRSKVEEKRKREHVKETDTRNLSKFRESRNEKDERHQSRNLLNNGSWRGANQEQDMVVRRRGRDDNQNTPKEKVNDLHSKRRKEGEHISLEHAEKEEIIYNHRESSGYRKRGRDDGSDQRKRDDHAKPKYDDGLYVRQKEEGLFQRERSERRRDHDEWHRLKPSHEENFSRREREEPRPLNSGRATEDKTWVSHSRVKDDYKGSGREYRSKDAGQHLGQLKKRDQIKNEKFSQHSHEGVYAHGNQITNGEKKARHERPQMNDERVSHATDTSRVHGHKREECSRKSKESGSGDRNTVIPSKRNGDDCSGQISEAVNLRARTGRERRENDNHVNRRSSGKQGEEVSSDGEQTISRKGRTKLERWTSHKEMDFSITAMPSSSLKSKDQDTYKSSTDALINRLPTEPSEKVEVKAHLSANDKETAPDNSLNAHAEDKHLDTVEKLKKRSERFKLPMPSEKDATAIKKLESEPLPPAQTENGPALEIKPERPARKRRWIGN